MTGQRITPEQRQAIWKQMRVPTYAFAALLAGLAGIVLIGTLAPSHWGSILEFALTVAMVLTIILFSMEIVEEDGLMRFFSALGFVWLGALFTMTMVDYLTR